MTVKHLVSQCKRQFLLCLFLCTQVDNKKIDNFRINRDWFEHFYHNTSKATTESRLRHSSLKPKTVWCFFFFFFFRTYCLVAPPSSFPALPSPPILNLFLPLVVRVVFFLLLSPYNHWPLSSTKRLSGHMIRAGPVIFT